jgi:peptidoglycan/xylan/chitin deacetylase (PgdA/CDA1 family)
MKTIFSLVLLCSLTTAYSHQSEILVSSSQALLEKEYAEIYADYLIDQFDKELDLRIATADKSEYLNTSLYANILSSRSFIEQRGFASGNIHDRGSTSIIKVQNTNLYLDIIRKINAQAEVIKNNRNSIYKKRLSDPLIYPSTTTSGNLTGNTYPPKVWSLTFDDGPRGQKTRTVVDNLYSRGIKATFFMLTSAAKKYSKTSQYVVDAGMEIALHSYTHKDLNKQSLSMMEYEITDAKKDLESLLGVKTQVFRLPYGSGLRNKDLRSVISKNDYVHIFWNIDTLDWKDKDPQSIFLRVKKQMALTRNGSGIILYHDIHTQSVISSELAMDYLLENGHKICTVSEVIDHLNGKKIDCVE